MEHYNTGFRHWFVDNLIEHARDIVEHGADCGFPHITMTAECADTFDLYATEIWEWACDDADDQGVNVAELIASFGRADMADAGWPQFKNLMLWYACEKVAREIVEQADEEPEEDGEIINMEDDATLVFWNEEKGERYIDGTTVDQFGRNNIRPHEWMRLLDAANNRRSNA